jgi:phospholipase C
MTDSATTPAAGLEAAAAAPTLVRISAAADGSVWGVDGENAAWQLALSPEAWTAYGSMSWVASASDGSVFAVDGDGGFHELAADGSWQPLAGLEQGELAQVAAGSASLVWGIDGDGGAYTWDGSQWNGAAALPGGDLFASIDIADAGTIWALGRSQTAYQWVGAPTDWQAVTAPEKLKALAVGAAGWVWAIGVSDTCYRWAGPDADDQWPSVPAAATSLAGLACGDDGSVWAFDGSGGAYVFDASSKSWTGVTGPDGATFACLSVADSSMVWAVTEKNGVLSVFRYTAALRTWQPGAAPFDVHDLAVASAADLWAVAVDGSVHRWQNAAWDPQPVGGSLKSIDAATDGTVWGAAGDGTVWRYVGGATVWTPVTCQAKLLRVAVGSTSTVVGIDGSGVLYRYDGTDTWPTIPLDRTSGSLEYVAVGEEDVVWGVDSSNDAFVYIEDGPGWYGAGSDIVAVGCGTAADVWAVTTAGVPLQLTNPAAPAEGAPVAAGRVRAPRWDTEDPFDETQSTHLWIVNRAAALAVEQGDVGAQICNLVQPFKGQLSGPGSDFHNQLCQGLYDADFKAPYNDAILKIPWYVSHFYDPDTGLNYWGGEDPTALSRGVACATAGLDAAVAGDWATAGYLLGLGLHYFTDLTQPMHAANFTNLSARPVPWYHADFESHVLTVQASVPKPDAYAVQLLPDLAAYYRSAAQNSKHHWFPALCPPAVTGDYWGWSGDWATYVKPLVPPMLQEAIQATSPFLVAWMQALIVAESTQVVSLVSATTGQVVDVPHSSKVFPVQQWTWNGGKNQQWLAMALGGADAGYYRLASPLQGALGVPPGSTAPGTLLAVYPWSPAADELKWTLVDAPDGSFAFQNKATELWLTCGPASATGSRLTVQNRAADGSQQWITAPFPSVMLECLGTAQVMDVHSNSTSPDAIVDQFPAKPLSDAANQEWLRVPLMGVAEESYAILNRNSGLALDIRGAQLVQEPWAAGAPSQAWGLLDAGSSGAYNVVNRSAPGLVVSVTGTDPHQNALPLILDRLVPGSSNQEWKTIEVPLGS